MVRNDYSSKFWSAIFLIQNSRLQDDKMNQTLLLLVFSFAVLLVGHVTAELPVARDKRSDDLDPMETVVSGLSQQVSQLTAQLQALDNKCSQQIADVKTQLLNNIEPRVGKIWCA